MKQVITVFILALTAVVFLADFVWRILAAIWPVAAAAALLVILSGALSLSLALVARGVRSLRPAPLPVEVIPPVEAGRTFEQRVEDFIKGSEPDEAVHADRCRAAMLRFAWVGEHYGFGIDDLRPFISRKKRQVYINLLTAKPYCILVTGTEGTRWGPGWNYGGFRAALTRRLIALPYPDDDLPYVDLTGAVERAKRTNRTHWSEPNGASEPWRSPSGAYYLSPMGG